MRLLSALWMHGAIRQHSRVANLRRDAAHKTFLLDTAPIRRYAIATGTTKDQCTFR